MNSVLNQINSTKLVSLGLAGLLTFQLTACGGGGGTTAADSSGVAPTSLTSHAALSTPTKTTTAAASASVAAMPTGPYITANVDVLRATQGATISPNFLGLSYEKAEMANGVLSASDTALVNMMKRLGNGVFRIGGNSVNTTTWSTTGAASSTVITPAEVAQLASLARVTGWKVIYGLNHATNTPENMASEAKYVAGKLGSSLLGFEIGNEPDLYKYNGLRPTSYTFAQFESEWQTYYNAVVAAVPGAKVTAVATSNNLTGYTIPFAHDKGSELSMLTHHYYFASGDGANASTMSQLLAGDPGLVTQLQKLKAAATAASIPGGYRIDEANTWYDGWNVAEADDFGTALWMLDFLFINAENGSAGVNIHGGWTTTFSPIYDNNVSVTSARPEYYGMLLFSMALNGTVLSTQTTTSAATNFTSHAVSQKNGSTMVLLNNKDATKSAYTTISLGKYASTAELHTLTGTNLNSPTGFALNGEVVASTGVLAAGTANNVRVGSNGTVTITVPPMSAIMVYAY